MWSDVSSVSYIGQLLSCQNSAMATPQASDIPAEAPPLNRLEGFTKFMVRNKSNRFFGVNFLFLFHILSIFPLSFMSTELLKSWQCFSDQSDRLSHRRTTLQHSCSDTLIRKPFFAYTPHPHPHVILWVFHRCSSVLCSTSCWRLRPVCFFISN